MSVPIEALIAAALIVALAYAVFGLTGFGASIVAMPLLVTVFPLRFAVPMMLLFDFTAGLSIALRNLRRLQRAELLRLLPTMAIGMALGFGALVSAPERLLLGVLGAFVLSYAAWNLLARVCTDTISPRWAWPAGAIGGVFSALFGTGGPIYAVYLTRRIADKSDLRATVGTVILCSAIVRLFMFTTGGLYAQDDLLLTAALLLPFALGGLWLGSHAHHRLPVHRVVQAVWGLLILGGLGLLARSVAGA